METITGQTGPAKRITLMDSAGARYVWKVYRRGQFWSLEDHDGTVRSLERVFVDSIPRIELTARNYDFTLLTPLAALAPRA